MAQVDTLDLKQLADCLEAHVDGFRGPITADKFDGGQSNPTFRIKAASGEYVLRRQPPGKLLKSAHAVDREFRVMRALADTDVPVPEVHYLCEDRDVIGSMFFVMECCQGVVLWDNALPEVDKAQRGAIFDEMNRVLAALHDVDVAAVGLADYGKPGNYFARQVGRWSKQYKASETVHIEAMEQLIAWLNDHMLEDDGQVSLVHGDYVLNNMMWSLDRSRIIAVIDWELSTLGNPLADLAYQCMRLRLPSGTASDGTLAGKDRHALGIPTEKEYVARYCQRRGISHIDHWEFYLAFGFFRLAAIVQGIAKRALDGNASNAHAAEVGNSAKILAEMGLDVALNGAE